MIEALRGQPLHTITPDRGREFQLHGNAALKRTLTACCASILRKVTTSTTLPTKSCKRWLIRSITDHVNVWVIEHRRKDTFLRCCTWFDNSLAQRKVSKRKGLYPRNGAILHRRCGGRHPCRPGLPYPLQINLPTRFSYQCVTTVLTVPSF